MDKLNSLRYSVSHSYSRSSFNNRKIWKYYDEDNQLKNLEYEYTVYNISAINKKTTRKEDTQQITEKYSVSYFDIKKHYEYIEDIDKWIESKFHLLKKSYDNFMKSIEIIDFITKELGEYNYATTYEVGWSVKDFYKLYIDLYSTTITLKYKNKETVLSETKLKTFIQKNKKLINQAKENEHKKYLQRLSEQKEQTRIEKLTEETEKLQLKETSGHDATRKVGSSNRHTSFSITRTLKERYETQACKPFPQKFPWERKSKSK
jgi:hypothetical protein